MKSPPHPPLSPACGGEEWGEGENLDRAWKNNLNLTKLH